MTDSEKVRLEVVYAKPDRQFMVEVTVADGTTIAQAIEESGVLAAYPEEGIESLPVAIWGEVVDRSIQVKGGDRIEILRPLIEDPREFRRNLALDGKYMGSGGAKPDPESTR